MVRASFPGHWANGPTDYSGGAASTNKLHRAAIICACSAPDATEGRLSAAFVLDLGPADDSSLWRLVGFAVERLQRLARIVQRHRRSACSRFAHRIVHHFGQNVHVERLGTGRQRQLLYARVRRPQQLLDAILCDFRTPIVDFSRTEREPCLGFQQCAVGLALRSRSSVADRRHVHLPANKHHIHPDSS